MTSDGTPPAVTGRAIVPAGAENWAFMDSNVARVGPGRGHWRACLALARASALVRPQSLPSAGASGRAARRERQSPLRRALSSTLCVERRQLAPDQLLERSNLPAEGRLRDIEPLGRAAKVELLSHGHERPQVPQLNAVRCVWEGNWIGSRSGHRALAAG